MTIHGIPDECRRISFMKDLLDTLLALHGIFRSPVLPAATQATHEPYNLSNLMHLIADPLAWEVPFGCR